jgi:uncharacterized membrane protein (UPF0127 family)
MGKKGIIFFIIVVLAIAGCALFFYGRQIGIFSYSASISLLENKEKICFENNCYFIEGAKTPEEREKGLSDREELAQNKGMFFIFEKEGIYPFWMKNMNFPLDIVWLDKDNKVVYLVENVKPCDAGACQIIYPDQKAQYILEINAGEAGKIGLKEGSIVEFK